MNYANQELKKGSEAVQWYITAGEWNEPADERFFSRIGLGEVELHKQMPLDFFEAPNLRTWVTAGSLRSPAVMYC